MFFSDFGGGILSISYTYIIGGLLEKKIDTLYNLQSAMGFGVHESQYYEINVVPFH